MFLSAARHGVARLVTARCGSARQSRHNALGLGIAGRRGAAHGKFRLGVAGGGSL